MGTEKSYTKDDLVRFTPQHPTFVGIDSDGCVFDTMEVKQKKFFHPQIIKFWGLEKVEPWLRETAEFVNLYSKWRGTNRFLALLETMDLLKERPEVIDTGVEIPACGALRAYIDSGIPLSNATLKQRVEETGDPELKILLDWSLSVNVDIAQNMEEIPPFKWVRECLEKTDPHSDSIVVSQTPEEALVHEWHLHGINGYVEMIAGQELGTKAEHLQMAAGGKYSPEQILMIGDAPGDRKAANAVNAFFYPILPGREEDSWKRFLDEAYDKFLAGSFGGTYQEELIEKFESLLPEQVPWTTV